MSYNKTVALIGNPNVGKSTVFNALTGLHQHTGNWPGKTVSNAYGFFYIKNDTYKIYDLPGIYSVLARSEEELIARDYICFENSDITVIVCDATSLLRNLNLVLQICEIKDNVILCVNLLDEAKKKGIVIDLKKLSFILGIPVVGTSARSNKGIKDLLNVISSFKKEKSIKVKYSSDIEKAISIIEKELFKRNIFNSTRFIALSILRDDHSIIKKYESIYNFSVDYFKEEIHKAKEYIDQLESIDDTITKYINDRADFIYERVILNSNTKRDNSKIDKILTSKITGIPIMIMTIMFIFWLTIEVANYPSTLLQGLFFNLEDKLFLLIKSLGVSDILCDLLIRGVYRVLAWVISVMLPPMAIFFPLFTLLEDLGYLPRIAFNLDGLFKKCNTCGKQALSMAMGFGCNSVGVSGCRIIDSKRERLIAIITNSFVPCNGKFPTMISIITMFFLGLRVGLKSSILCSLLLGLTISVGIFLTFIVSKVLSITILKGNATSFVLELPPYRKPQIIKVIIRSIFDRIVFVLGRAIVVAIPAGFIIWGLANIRINEITVLSSIANTLDPIGKLLGMDGVILLSFILGFPANEIVLPIIIMCYLSNGNLVNIDNLFTLKDLLIENGWTWKTAVSFITFSLIHWPCSTTCLTIKKETNSWRWTILSIIIPTTIGVLLCILLNFLLRVLL